MHPVVKVLLNRARKGSLPGKRDDGFKVGLAVEGGSLRGVVSAGMVTALESLGLVTAFDVVYGTSAGAINGAYFLSGQAAFGTTIYYENINNSSFVDLRRVLTPDPIVSLDYVFNDVLIRQKILDWERVLNSPVPLKAVASSVSLQQPVVLGDFSNREELFTALRASSQMPGVTGPPVSFRGDLFFDGSVYESVPYAAAIKGGCTHTLALLTRPAGCTLAGTSKVDKYLIGPWMRKYSPAMAKDIVSQRAGYLVHLARLQQATAQPSAQPFICAIACPEGSAVVDRLEKNRQRLVSGALLGASAIFDAFLLRPSKVIETLAVFDGSGHRPTLFQE
jgi:predicted patatin/cPLA2 family phospholipase